MNASASTVVAALNLRYLLDYPGEAARRLELMSAAGLLVRLEPEQRQHCLTLLDPQIVAELSKLMDYPPDSAGQLMDPRIVTLRTEFSVHEALTRLRRKISAVVTDIAPREEVVELLERSDGDLHGCSRFRWRVGAHHTEPLRSGPGAVLVHHSDDRHRHRRFFLVPRHRNTAFRNAAANRGLNICCPASLLQVRQPFETEKRQPRQLVPLPTAGRSWLESGLVQSLLTTQARL